MSRLSFKDRVVIVTGAGNGLGKAYALAFASRGARVVVNDLGGSFKGEGASTRAADLVVEEIRRSGGEAVANYDSVENGAAIVQTAVSKWGRVDVVVNNAGILRDKSFIKLTQEDWDLVYKVHLRGTYAVTKAAWPYMREQNFGRVICISSASGLYGNFGQANYSAAKLGVVGLAASLAKEGGSKNILVNVVCPVAGSRMTETVMPPELLEALKPEYVAPLVLVLAHEESRETGGIFEVGAGWVANVRWQRNAGLIVPLDEATQPEAYARSWAKLSDWSAPQYPTAPDVALVASIASARPAAAPKKSLPRSEAVDPNVALNAPLEGSTRVFSPKDLILYALGVGAGQDKPTCGSQLRYTYEHHPEFGMLPTMGVAFVDLMKFSVMPGVQFNPMMLLHGEHQLEVLSDALPTSGTGVTESRIVELWDKGKAALVVVESITRAEGGAPMFRNRLSAFIRGIGGWGGERGPKGPDYTPPARPADAVVRYTTARNQALLYRLASGDANPLHADPDMAAVGGFDKPILHGLCTFGYAGRAVIASFCNNDGRRFKGITVRFSGHVFPGETLETSMWRTSADKIVFETRVVERGTVVISNACVDIVPGPASSAKL